MSSMRALILSIIFGTVIFSILSLEAKPQSMDGPAELPRVYVKSNLAATPARGKTVDLRSGDDLQLALNTAECGETIRLESAAEFAGSFHFPAKNCDNSHWIVVRTDAPDSALPTEGNRVSPCYAGVASLPGRPRFACQQPKKVLAKLVLAKGTSVIRFADGANHYRLMNLEITRKPENSVINLAQLDGGGTADHLIFDRVWMHGTAQDETGRGIALGGSTYVAVVDSYFSDFHCVSITGACVDAQAVAGGFGNHPMGPYKITNNFMEGAAETVIFGGAGATVTPADIEIRRNHFFKPLSWKPGNSDFVGAINGRAFIVKNLFELKNAQRVLFEANILDYSWGGFSQPGYAILLTPKNQGGHCSVCEISDVTIRYNLVRHAAGGITIGTGLSDSGDVSSGGERISIHDNVFEDINSDTYKGFGVFAQITSTIPALRDVLIDHNTAFPNRALFVMGVQQGRDKIHNLTFTNNLVGTGDEGILGTGGGAGNCSFQPRRQGSAGVLNNCVVGLTFTHNALIGTEGGWPKDNLMLKNMESAGLLPDGTTCQAQSAGCKKAPSQLRAGGDGRPIGADVDRIRQYTIGVE